MIGVSFGAPREFKAVSSTDDADLPPWKPERIANALGQDDLYVELSFLQALEQHGLDITYEQAGKEFAQTQFGLWHANHAGRKNVREGIMPPESGSARHNEHWNDIDFQIESDLFGLINPGLPQSASAEGAKFGRIMNSEEGLYGGLFMAAMYAQAFFQDDLERIIREGLRAIPRDSAYAQTIRDVLRWHQGNPQDWRAAWRLVRNRYVAHPISPCSKPFGLNIDANVNGAYVVMALLYGKGDLANTMEIAVRCGQDSDCNASSAAGILCTVLGYKSIPQAYTAGIPDIANQKFAHTNYTFNDLVPICLRFARENIQRAGGSSGEVNGKEVFFIPAQEPTAAP